MRGFKITSEVLIINPNSLVLSSDGAVTIKGKKTFTGVKKLLQISCNPTVVMMYYGKPDFGLVEMESIIEEFKKQNDFYKLGTVNNIAEEFIKFLSRFTYPDNVKNFVIYNYGLFKKELTENFNGMSEELFWDFLASFDKIDLLSFIEDISFMDIIPDSVKNKSEANQELLKIFSYILANSGTGVVIAGFDKTQNRPSFIHLGLMINNDGKVEYEILDFEKNFDKSGIISFAQDDEINTFLYGINSELEDSIVHYIKELFNFYANDFYCVLDRSGDFDDETLKKIFSHINEFKLNFTYQKLFLDQIDMWKDENYQSFLEIIPFLPKHILADFAKFLIYVVSSKRKFSFDLESVGGNIDVCVVTKNKIQFF